MITFLAIAAKSLFLLAVLALALSIVFYLLERWFYYASKGVYRTFAQLHDLFMILFTILIIACGVFAVCLWTWEAGVDVYSVWEVWYATNR